METSNVRETTHRPDLLSINKVFTLETCPFCLYKIDILIADLVNGMVFPGYFLVPLFNVYILLVLITKSAGHMDNVSPISIKIRKFLLFFLTTVLEGIINA